MPVFGYFTVNIVNNLVKRQFAVKNPGSND